MTYDEYLKQLILSRLDKGNIHEAAYHLNMSTRTIIRHIKIFEIDVSKNKKSKRKKSKTAA